MVIRVDTMKNIFIKWFMATNAFLIKISKGRIGGKLGTQTILILHTVGRKPGQLPNIPVEGEEFTRLCGSMSQRNILPIWIIRR